MSAAIKTKNLEKLLLEFLSSSRPAVEPFSFRLPKDNETDPYFGGNRTFWNQRVLPSRNKGNPPVVSVVQKLPGTKRGIRFILYASAKEYFERLARAQASERQAA